MSIVLSTPAHRMPDPTFKRTSPLLRMPFLLFTGSLTAFAVSHLDASVGTTAVRVLADRRGVDRWVYTCTISAHTAHVSVWTEIGVCREDGYVQGIDTVSTTRALMV